MAERDHVEMTNASPDAADSARRTVFSSMSASGVSSNRLPASSTTASTNAVAPRSSAATIAAFAVRSACALAMAVNSACGPHVSGETRDGGVKPALTGTFGFECLELFDRSMSFTDLVQGVAMQLESICKTAVGSRTLRLKSDYDT
jgi:hypothetical protein